MTRNDVCGVLRGALAALLLLACAACDPAIGRVVYHLGDSTSYELGEELDAASQVRPTGDVIVRLATVPGFALGLQGPYYVGRLEAAAAPLVHDLMAYEMASFGLPVPRRLGSPDWVLVQLGTNDLRPDCDPRALALVDTDEELDAAIAQLLGAIPGEARILWVLPSPGVAADRREHFRAGIERAPRPIHLLELPPWLYEPDGIHFADTLCDAARQLSCEQVAADQIVAELDRLDGRVQP